MGIKKIALLLRWMPGNGYPLPGKVVLPPGKGVLPCLDLGRGTSHLDLGRGTPLPEPGKGVPPPGQWMDLGRGYPLVIGWGTPLPGSGKGIPPSIWTWEGGIPLFVEV